MSKLINDPGVDALVNLYQPDTAPSPEQLPPTASRSAGKGSGPTYPWDAAMKKSGPPYVQVHLHPELRAILDYVANTTYGESMRSIVTRGLVKELQIMLDDRGIQFDVAAHFQMK